MAATAPVLGVFSDLSFALILDLGMDWSPALGCLVVSVTLYPSRT